MARFAKVRSLSSALVLAFVVVLSFAGAGAAHAAPRTTSKAAVSQSCVWETELTQRETLWSPFPAVPVGYYEVALQHYSCDTYEHRGVGEFYLYPGTFYPNSAGCFVPTYILNVEIYYDGASANHSGVLQGWMEDTELNCNNGGSSYSSIVTGVNTNTYDDLYCVAMTTQPDLVTADWYDPITDTWSSNLPALATGYDAAQNYPSNSSCG